MIVLVVLFGTGPLLAKHESPFAWGRGGTTPKVSIGQFHARAHQAEFADKLSGTRMPKTARHHEVTMRTKIYADLPDGYQRLARTDARLFIT